MSDELKPCPFCGGGAEFERPGTPRQSCIVVCRDCGARLESGDMFVGNGQSWNSRDDDDLRTQLAAMTAERDEYERLLEYAADKGNRLLAERDAALAKVALLRDELDGIRQYGSDTLSGRADGGPDDRNWQREAVLVMTNRARNALEKTR